MCIRDSLQAAEVFPDGQEVGKDLGGMELVGPVSYTHLDVYKRQALPGNGTIPAVYSKRLQLAKHAGMAIMDMVNKGITRCV